MKKQFKMYSHTGFGLLDVMLALAVSAGIIILGINYYQNVTRQQKLNKTIEQMQTIHRVMTGIVNSGSTGNVASSSIASQILTGSSNITNNVLLANQLVAPSTVKSVWNGSQITVSGLSNMTFVSSETNLSITCLAVKIKICGIPASAVGALENKVKPIFENSSVLATKRDNCAQFTLCIQ